MKRTSRFLAQEIAHTSSGQVPEDSSNEAKAYIARVVDSDARKAAAYAHAFSTLDPLQKIRSFIRAGDLEAAKKCLQEIQAHDVSSEPVSELLLEETRLAVFGGEWERAISVSESALDFEVSSVSQLTLRQVRAVALLELGFFQRAHGELKLASSLTRLFPHASLELYVRATEIKIYIAEERFGEAEALLEKFWRKMISGADLNADNVLMILRCEMELARQTGRPWTSHAFTCWLLARAIGDQFYQAAAAIDIYYGVAESKMQWQNEFNQAIERFPRLAKLNQERNAGEHASTSARFLRAAQGAIFTGLPQDGLKMQTVLILQPGVKIELETLKVTAMKMPSQVVRAVNLLSSGPVSNADFFVSLWKHPKYVPHLHASGVRTLLHRLRKNFGIEAQTEDGRIQLAATWVLK